MASTSAGKARRCAADQPLAAGRRRRTWAASAPQQPWSGGTTTSTPCAASTRIAALGDRRAQHAAARSRSSAPRGRAGCPSPAIAAGRGDAAGTGPGSRPSIAPQRAGQQPASGRPRRPRRQRAPEPRAAIPSRSSSRACGARVQRDRAAREALAHRLDEVAVAHARRARRLAGQAPQAAIEVQRRLGERQRCPRAPPSSARCGRAASPSPRRAPCRSGRRAGRSRSARTTTRPRPWPRRAGPRVSTGMRCCIDGPRPCPTRIGRRGRACAARARRTTLPPRRCPSDRPHRRRIRAQHHAAPSEGERGLHVVHGSVVRQQHGRTAAGRPGSGAERRQRRGRLAQSRGRGRHLDDGGARPAPSATPPRPPRRARRRRRLEYRRLGAPRASLTRALRPRGNAGRAPASRAHTVGRSRSTSSASRSSTASRRRSCAVDRLGQRSRTRPAA